MSTQTHTIRTSTVAYFLFNSRPMSYFWLVVRVYVGWEWLEAGWGKLHSAAWVGAEAGTSLTGFVQGALEKTGGPHPSVQGWYAAFLQSTIMPHPVFWSYIVTWGEILVGIALILGFLVGVSAFFGVFMNANYLFAGTVSTNPQLLLLGIGLVLAWRIAGALGLDRFILPYLRHPICIWRKKVDA